MILGLLPTHTFHMATKMETKTMFYNNIAFRRREIARTPLGQKLVRACGPDFDNIYWDTYVDQPRLMAAIAEQKPDVILALGKVVRHNLRGIWHGPVIYLPHALKQSTPQEAIDNVVKETLIAHYRIRTAGNW